MEVVIIADLPIATSDDLSTTELALLLQQVTAANIIDFVDAQDVKISAGGYEPALDETQFQNYGELT